MKELNVGDQAPEFFELTVNRGRTVVVYFYPQDFTPGCTTEACNFRDLYEKITEKQAIVLGISPDPPESHEKFIAEHGLPYALVSDEEKSICLAYGVWTENSRNVERTTFIIGPNGAIKKIFRKVKPEGHAREVLAAL
jgi:thioredoxin-dependent peroxiredoxin